MVPAAIRRAIGLGAPLILLALAGLPGALLAQGAPAPDRLVVSHGPLPDAFYDPPAEAPSVPGVLLRSERLDAATLPAGLRGWRILYTTTVDDATPATAAATVFASAEQVPDPRPVIAWGHGTTGLQQRCMPSLSAAPAGGIPALAGVVRAGWAVVATDYSFVESDGTHPYLIGDAQARSALDAVRAARQLSAPKLDRRTVIWGHSQGGHAALWAGIVGPDYAPDVEILGIAAIAPPADLARLLAFSPRLDKRVGPYLAMAYSRFYPDIAFDQALRPAAREAGRGIAGLCAFSPIEDRRRVAELMASFEGRSLATDRNPALAARLAENAADRPIAAPLLVVQGGRDVVVPPATTEAYVQERCAAGQALEYWTFKWVDHSGITQSGGPLERPLLEWTEARFAGEPWARGCVVRRL
jgi:pimeloyl-ACP methyl ester carboxylesterase